ncbi:glutathione S-transferase family protein [Acuticoccus kandeliae]|uniref:glutathione S-transferase family protein n=1 Tax=Acuticoccus kandeliae TaxID=2073160 RepID=UPI000D3E412A|nr:glutathione S-transferase family protein [Acuticoccus kandeliae]
MLKFYYNTAPNPMKVALFLEESGLDYEAVPVDTREGEQHTPAYKAINPNAKVPAIVDGGETVFDSNAILLYLAEKTGQFLPDGHRGALLSWLMFVATGVGPYSGQAVHFRHFALGDRTYGRKRYDFEARRHWGIVDARLAEGPYMLGETYTIVDMAVWGWASRIPFMFDDANAMAQFPNIKRLTDWIDERPAAARVRALMERHAFKPVLDEDAKRHMYPQMFAPDPA